MLGPRAPPSEAEIKKGVPFKEIDIFAASTACRALEGIEDILRPRQEAASISSGPLYDGNQACPPYIPLMPPKLTVAPWAMQDLAQMRVAEVGSSPTGKLG